MCPKIYTTSVFGATILHKKVLHDNRLLQKKEKYRVSLKKALLWFLHPWRPFNGFWGSRSVQTLSNTLYCGGTLILYELAQFYTFGNIKESNLAFEISP